jgi:4'-phosphopantetheinyl transferase
LNKRPIELWYGHLADVYAPGHWSVLDAVELAYVQRLKNESLRQRYASVHGCLRQLLARYLQESPRQIKIKKAEHGKPYLVDHPELAFNISHSGDALLIALGWNCELGVDLELCKERNSLAGLVEKCFAEEEAAYWHRLPETEKKREFYRFWTRKEAFVKATGRGLALGLNQCVINPDRSTEFLRVPESCGAAAEWRVQDIDLGPAYCAALAARNAELKHIEVRAL